MKNLKNNLYLFLILSLPIGTQAMEQAPFEASLSGLPAEVKVNIAAHLEGADCLATLGELSRLMLINKEWESIALDPQLIRHIIEKYKEQDRQNGLSYHARINQAAEEWEDAKEMHSQLEATYKIPKKEIKDLKHGTFYSEFVEAAGLGHLPLVKLLVENDPDLKEIATLDAQTALNQALITAVNRDFSDIVKYLIERGAQVDAVNLRNHSPLFIAAQRNCLQTLPILLGEAVFEARSGKDAIMAALNNNHNEAASLIIDKAALVSTYTIIGGPQALKLAANMPNETLVKKLLDCGCTTGNDMVDSIKNDRKRPFEGEDRKEKKKIIRLVKAASSRVFVRYFLNQLNRPVTIVITLPNGDIQNSYKIDSAIEKILNVSFEKDRQGKFPTLTIMEADESAEIGSYTPSGINPWLGLGLVEKDGLPILRRVTPSIDKPVTKKRVDEQEHGLLKYIKNYTDEPLNLTVIKQNGKNKKPIIIAPGQLAILNLTFKKNRQGLYPTFVVANSGGQIGPRFGIEERVRWYGLRFYKENEVTIFTSDFVLRSCFK